MPLRKIRPIFILILGVATGLGFRSWDHSYLPLPNETLTDIRLHPADPAKLLAASSRALYLREGERRWKRLFSWEGKSISRKQLISHSQLSEKIFLLAEEGVAEVDLKDGRLKWIFRETNPSKNRIHALALHPDDPHRIYVGTEHGLFQSQDGGRNWSGPLGWPENESIQFVAFLPSEPRLLLLGTGRELFFSKDDGNSFESGFSLPLFSKEEHEESLEEKEDVSGVARFSSVAYSSQDLSHLWVGTREGVFESRDGGISWERLPDQGLQDPQVYHLLFSERSGQLVAATSRGVARFHPATRRWETLSVGLTRPPHSIALRALPENEGEVLLIASGNEVVEWILKPLEIPRPPPPFLPSPERMELFGKLIACEPTARDIQKQAIRYGNLGNGKIRRWQGGSRLRGFIPSLSFGKKLSLNNNIDVDRGGTNTPDVFILGPDKVDKGWELGLRWELGDFLYSSAQTQIDSRQKLNVELRESILSEVTRIYFERRRVQMEITLSPPEAPHDYFDLLLRLEELTSQLDALTDGYLSWKIEKMERTHPELRELWQKPD